MELTSTFLSRVPEVGQIVDRRSCQDENEHSPSCLALEIRDEAPPR